MVLTSHTFWPRGPVESETARDVPHFLAPGTRRGPHRPRPPPLARTRRRQKRCSTAPHSPIVAPPRRPWVGSCITQRLEPSSAADLPATRHVSGTNFCDLTVRVPSVGKESRHAIVISCLDNLIKGASGQAVQNMNILFKKTKGNIFYKPICKYLTTVDNYMNCSIATIKDLDISLIDFVTAKSKSIDLNKLKHENRLYFS